MLGDGRAFSILRVDLVLCGFCCGYYLLPIHLPLTPGKKGCRGNPWHTCLSITQAERDYIAAGLPATNAVSLPIPWKSIITSIPFWALMFSNIANNWGFHLLMTELPQVGIVSDDFHYSGFFSTWEKYSLTTWTVGARLASGLPSPTPVCGPAASSSLSSQTFLSGKRFSRQQQWERYLYCK